MSVEPVQPGSYIMPAEFVGMAKETEGVLNIGGLDVRTGGWSVDETIAVYVRRSSRDLSIVEVVMARHDGYAQEELDEQNRQPWT